MFRSNIAGQPSIIVIKFYRIYENFCYRHYSLNLDHKNWLMTSVTVSEQYPSRSIVLDIGSVIDSKGVWPLKYRIKIFISDPMLIHLRQHWAKNTEDSAKCQLGIFFNQEEMVDLNSSQTALLLFFQGIYFKRMDVRCIIVFKYVTWYFIQLSHGEPLQFIPGLVWSGLNLDYRPRHMPESALMHQDEGLNVIYNR